ncbi:UPF0149 family protein [Pseudoxanthomonas wuyuanensis]
MTEPMTEAELDELSWFLDEHTQAREGMTLEILDGFLSALVVGPALVMPSEYLPFIWSKGQWRDVEQAQGAFERIIRFWNHIVWRVQASAEEQSPEIEAMLIPSLMLPEKDDGEGEDADEPDLSDIPDDFPFAFGWASGFLQGVSLRPEPWAAWTAVHEDIADDLELIAALAVMDRHHALEMDLPELEPMNFRERFEACMDLPTILLEMNLQRLEDLRLQPVRREPQPGRNDPCSCGSGLKYKKCCGAGGQDRVIH